MKCKECGGAVKNGKCVDCGYKAKEPVKGKAKGKGKFPFPPKKK